ncbi:MBL fold metallo-hydrolase [Elusimicrobiota bacterium]
MKIKFWGPRGSIPVPNRDMIKYGGNTTCVEVNCGEKTLIIDAGTGIINLGNHLKKQNVRDINLLITHTHWDHIHGLPFFAPLYDAKTKVNIYGYGGSYKQLEVILKKQMSYEYFPVRFMDLKSKIKFIDVSEKCYKDTDYKLEFIRNNHPAFTISVKIIKNKKSFVFITDNELMSKNPITKRSEFVKFCKNADYLVHDAQFKNSEYSKRLGWGHSTFEQAIDLAKDARVKNLGFFHHDPNRTDKELKVIESYFKKLYKNDFNVFAIQEMDQIRLR